MADIRQPTWTKEEELKDVVYRGSILSGYKVARNGIVISYKQSKEGKPLTWTRRSIGVDYPTVKLQISVEAVGTAYNKDSYNYKNAAAGMTALKVSVHSLVAHSWSIDSCPSELEEYWSKFPSKLKEILKSYFQIDHIDNDRWNPDESNLRFVSSRHNNPHTKAAMQKEVIKNSS